MTIPAHWPPAPEGHPEAPERRAYVFQLMAACLWVRGESAPILAAHWGYSVKTIEGDSAEASKLLRAAMPAAEDARALVVNLALSAAEDAATIGDASKRSKAKVDAGKLLAQVTGANAPVKHQVQTTDGDEPWFEPEAK